MFFASDNWAGIHPNIAAGLNAHAFKVGGFNDQGFIIFCA